LINPSINRGSTYLISATNIGDPDKVLFQVPNYFLLNVFTKVTILS
jgi:hypothetical protein